jgi:hypothetical protein
MASSYMMLCSFVSVRTMNIVHFVIDYREDYRNTQNDLLSLSHDSLFSYKIEGYTEVLIFIMFEDIISVNVGIRK